MKISKRQLSLIIENYLLTEAVHDKVAAQLGITDPDKIEQLRIASEVPHRLQKPDLLWIAQYFTTPEGMETKEPIEDIVASIKSLKQNKAALMRRGSSVNLSDYESPGQINIAVSLSRGFVDISQLGEQVDVLYEDDNWTLYMPHSREASCTIGRGTTWCTAIPGSGNNLFYNYVISGRAILYYLVKKQQLENESPATTHFSLGTIGGKIPFPEEGKGNGHIVVDGSNKGLSKDRFLGIVGDQLGNQLITVIEQHSQTNRNQHPAKNKIMEMLKNPALYVVEMRGKSIDVRYDFTSMLVQQFLDVVGSQTTSEEEDNLIIDTFINPDNLFNKAIAAETKIEQKDIDAYETALQTKNDAVIQTYGKIFGDGGVIKDAEYRIRSVNNDSTLAQVENRFCKDLDKLSGVVPYHLYHLVERLAQSTANGWEGSELYEHNPGQDVIDTDENVTPNVKYFVEEDPALMGIETNSFLDKHLREFISMLEVYHANILIENGYCLVHDSQYWNNSGQKDDFAGQAVVHLRDWIGAERSEIHWVDDRYWGYEHAPFTSREIQDYMQSDPYFSQEFIDWCNQNGFTFTA